LYAKRLYVFRLHILTHKPEKEMRCMKTEENEMPRTRVSITLPQECLEWIDKQVEARVYHNRSHAIEVVILKEMQKK